VSFSSMTRCMRWLRQSKGPPNQFIRLVNMTILYTLIYLTHSVFLKLLDHTSIFNCAFWKKALKGIRVTPNRKPPLFTCPKDVELRCKLQILFGTPNPSHVHMCSIKDDGNNFSIWFLFKNHVWRMRLVTNAPQCGTSWQRLRKLTLLPNVV
jgi:hypothetical protein